MDGEMREAGPPLSRLEAGDEEDSDEDEEPDEALEEGEDEDWWLVLPAWFS